MQDWGGYCVDTPTGKLTFKTFLELLKLFKLLEKDEWEIIIILIIIINYNYNCNGHFHFGIFVIFIFRVVFHDLNVVGSQSRYSSSRCLLM